MDILYFDDALNPSPAADQRALLSASSFSASIQGSLTGGRRLVTYWDPRVLLRDIDKRRQPPLLAVLDILNENRDTRIEPRGNCGIAVAKGIYARWPRVPIIFLSFFDEDSPERYEAGDIRSIRDFVTKGRSNTVSRLQQAIARLSCTHPPPPTEWGRLKLDHQTRIASWRGKAMGEPKVNRLTPSEYSVVERIVEVTLAKREAQVPSHALHVTFDEIRNGLEMSDEVIYGRMTEIRMKFSRKELELTGQILPLDAIFRSETRAYRLVEPE